MERKNNPVRSLIDSPASAQRRKLLGALALAPVVWSLPTAVGAKTATPALASDGTWDAKRSWFFGMCLTEWADADSMAPFPKAGRRDIVLRDCVAKRGVPAGHMTLLLDREATRRRVRKHFIDMLNKSEAGDFLWFHYSGHGWRAGGSLYLLPYDTDGSSNRASKDTAYKLSELLDDIEANFRGSHVLLTADCCFSGQMAKVAPERNGRIAFGAITSSLSSEPSTGNWTFTNALIDGLTGQGTVDLDHDGGIDLIEIAKYAGRAMAFEEEQLGSFEFAPGFPKRTEMSKVVTQTAKGIGRHVEVYRQESWQKAVVTEINEAGEVRVRLAQTDSALDKWFREDRIRDYEAKVIPKGTRVEVKMKGRWISGVIIAERLGVHHVRFDGQMEDDDEWVPIRKIRVAK